MQTGLYRHFKGNIYEVIGLARHSETEEKYVVYRAKYGDGDLWIRPQEMFYETVFFEGQEVLRFQYLDKGSAEKTIRQGP